MKTESKNFHVVLPKDVDNNLKLILSKKELLAEQTIKNEIMQLLSK